MFVLVWPCILTRGFVGRRVRGTQWTGYAGPPLPSPRLKVSLAAQQLVELLNILSSQPGWSRHAVARAVCTYATEALPSQMAQSPCRKDSLGFEGLDLNSMDYGGLSAKQLGNLRLRIIATILAARQDTLL